MENSLYLIFSGLSCYACLDVEILETDRPSNEKSDFYEKLAYTFFGERVPKPCADAEILECSDGQNACLFSSGILGGTCK